MSLFIGNVSKNVRRQDLVDAFEHFGKCDVNIKVPIHLDLMPSPLSPYIHASLLFSY